jgi:hypothetical protein
MSKDEHSTGIILAGEPALAANLQFYLPRFASHAGNLFHSLSGLSVKEVKDYLKDFNFEVEALEMIAERGKKTSFRILDRTLKNLFRNINPTDLISVKDIEKAGEMMMFK